MEYEKITVEAIIEAPITKVWDYWVIVEHIMKWNSASPDWHTPRAENDLRTGGRFTSRMEAKDGSFGFDFGGIYDEVIPHKTINYTMDDGRKTTITFMDDNGERTHVTETFDAETTNPIEMQQGGWQAILDNFKKYAEAN
jgi:uncharacterized protein YndB with AHSA1/START domain